MKKQKNKFINFLFAFIPGASQMYMGFMRRGTSLIIAAMAAALLIGWIDSMFIFVLLVVEAYSFFDGINRNGASPEEFEQLTDDYFFNDFVQEGIKFDLSKVNYKVKKIAGIAIIILGICLLGENILSILVSTFNLSSIINRLYHEATFYIPRLAFSALVIYAGYALIKGKKQQIIDEIADSEVHGE